MTKIITIFGLIELLSIFYMYFFDTDNQAKIKAIRNALISTIICFFCLLMLFSKDLQEALNIGRYLQFEGKTEAVIEIVALLIINFIFGSYCCHKGTTQADKNLANDEKVIEANAPDGDNYKDIDDNYDGRRNLVIIGLVETAMLFGLVYFQAYWWAYMIATSFSIIYAIWAFRIFTETPLKQLPMERKAELIVVLVVFIFINFSLRMYCQPNVNGDNGNLNGSENVIAQEE